MDAKEFWDKVKLRLKELKKRQDWLSEETGINLQSIRNKIHLKKFPSLEDTLSILKALDLSWSDFEEYPDIKEELPEVVEVIVEKEGKKLPVYELPYLSDTGMFTMETAVIKEYVPVPDHLKEFESSLMAGYARGKAMEPTLYDGDVILFDKKGYDGNDGVYVIVWGNFGYTRRLHKTPEGFEILSDNSYFTPMFENNGSDDFIVIGRVHEVHHHVV